MEYSSALSLVHLVPRSDSKRLNINYYVWPENPCLTSILIDPIKILPLAIS